MLAPVANVAVVFANIAREVKIGTAWLNPNLPSPNVGRSASWPSAPSS